MRDIWKLELGGSAVKNLPANAEDTGSILESGRSPEEGNSNALWHSCLGNPMDRKAWRATVHGVAKESDTSEHEHAHRDTQGNGITSVIFLSF